MSDGSETNNPIPVTNDAAPVIEVLKGNPTEDEVAALVAVLGSLGGGATEPAQPERTNWGLPVDSCVNVASPEMLDVTLLR